MKIFAEKKRGHLPGASASAGTCSPWQLTGITSVKLQFSLSFNQKLYITLEIARPLRETPHGQGQGVSTRPHRFPRWSVSVGSACKPPTFCSRPGFQSRRQRPLWRDMPRCDMPCRGWPHAALSRVHGTPAPPQPSRSQAGWVGAHRCNLILKKNLGQASESTEISPSDLWLEKWLLCS